MAPLVKIKLHIVVITLFFLSWVPAATGETYSAKLTNAEKATVSRVERYFNSIQSLQSRFLQFSSTGGQAQGDILILRPGMLRIKYDPPVPIEIISDGTWLIYNDKEMKTASHYPLESTPANILVKNNISFTSGDLRLTRFNHESGVIKLTLIRSDDPDGEITLIFADKPLMLKKWIVIDVQGVTTTVTLMKSRFGAPLKPEMFSFIDPYANDNLYNN